MNIVQKRIVITVIVTIAGMLAYPPFHLIVKNDTVMNMGYSWITSPPVLAYYESTVNISLLLTQWIAVLVIGGLAFLLTKTSSNTSSSTGSEVTHRPTEEHQPPQIETTVSTASTLKQQPGYGVYAIHFFAFAFSVPLVRDAAQLRGAIPYLIGCVLAIWLSKLAVSRIYALNIKHSTRTTILWSLPVAYFLIYMLMYYVLASATQQ